MLITSWLLVGLDRIRGGGFNRFQFLEEHAVRLNQFINLRIKVQCGFHRQTLQYDQRHMTHRVCRFAIHALALPITADNNGCLFSGDQKLITYS